MIIFRNYCCVQNILQDTQCSFDLQNLIVRNDIGDNQWNKCNNFTHTPYIVLSFELWGKFQIELHACIINLHTKMLESLNKWECIYINRQINGSLWIVVQLFLHISSFYLVNSSPQKHVLDFNFIDMYMQNWHKA